MKPDSQPQLLAEIEQHGSVTHIESALINRIASNFTREYDHQVRMASQK